MNSMTHALPIVPRIGGANMQQRIETARAWAAQVGWAVLYRLQIYGARRALSQMRLLGFDVDHGFALPTNGKNTSGQAGARR